MGIFKTSLAHYFGEIVYVKTDPYQLRRIVTTIKIQPGDIIQYGVDMDGEPTEFKYAFELTSERDMAYMNGDDEESDDI